MRLNKLDLRGLGILVRVVVLVILSMTSAGADTIVPQHADRKAVEEFLIKLGKQFPNESQRLIEFNDEGEAITRNDAFEFEQLHSLWIADVNNDGLKEYFWTTEAEGSGHLTPSMFIGCTQTGRSLNWIGPSFRAGCRC